jgi:hypothetical protein
LQWCGFCDFFVHICDTLVYSFLVFNLIEIYKNFLLIDNMLNLKSCHIYKTDKSWTIYFKNYLSSLKFGYFYCWNKRDISMSYRII